MTGVETGKASLRGVVRKTTTARFRRRRPTCEFRLIERKINSLCTCAVFIRTRTVGGSFQRIRFHQLPVFAFSASGR